MRTFLLSAALFLAAGPAFRPACAQLPVDAATGKTTFTDVVTVESATAAQLFARGQQWLKGLVGYKAVIKSEDKTKFEIKATITYTVFITGKEAVVDFECTLQCKDGRYKYTYTNFYFTWSGKAREAYESPTLGPKRDIWDSTNTKIKTFADKMKTALGTAAAEEKASDW